MSELNLILNEIKLSLEVDINALVIEMFFAEETSEKDIFIRINEILNIKKRLINKGYKRESINHIIRDILSNYEFLNVLDFEVEDIDLLFKTEIAVKIKEKERKFKNKSKKINSSNEYIKRIEKKVNNLYFKKIDLFLSYLLEKNINVFDIEEKLLFKDKIKIEGDILTYKENDSYFPDLIIKDSKLSIIDCKYYNTNNIYKFWENFFLSLYLSSHIENIAFTDDLYKDYSDSFIQVLKDLSVLDSNNTINNYGIFSIKKRIKENNLILYIPLEQYILDKRKEDYYLINILYTFLYLLLENERFYINLIDALRLFFEIIVPQSNLKKESFIKAIEAFYFSDSREKIRRHYKENKDDEVLYFQNYINAYILNSNKQSLSEKKYLNLVTLLDLKSFDNLNNFLDKNNL